MTGAAEASESAGYDAIARIASTRLTPAAKRGRIVGPMNLDWSRAVTPAIGPVVLVIAACGGTPAEPVARPPIAVAAVDSCAGGRPDFGGVATAADRALFGYDVTAPLNPQRTVESTNDGVEVSSISFGSPDGGSVTGMMWDPVTRSSPRPGMVLMHGLPGSARAMAGLAQRYARYGAVWIRAMAPVEPMRFVGHAVVPLLLQNGTLDSLVPRADAAALHAAAPEPKTIRWYDAGHSLDLQALRDRHEWLNGQIGLDLPK